MDRNTDLKRGSRKDSVNLIEKRIFDKIKDYENYSFNTTQDCALKTFFDLSQEFESRYDIYCICVLIPKIFFKYECTLYLIDLSGELKVACYSEDILDLSNVKRFKTPDLYEKPVISGTSFYLPVKGNIAQLSDLPGNAKNGVFGVFEICKASDLSDNMKFFFEKYVNRIGFHLHNRTINDKNQEHLSFIRSLVNDIGHNIIVPNMFFKLFFKRLQGKIDRAGEIGRELKEKSRSCFLEQDKTKATQLKSLIEELDYINNSMEEQFQQILSHYEQTSLFLETLLRRSHFEQGRYVLESRLININDKIIKPQLSRYLPRLQERGISIDNQVAVNPDKEVMISADVGLISQAYANLFSNAVKYTREVYDEHGKPEKYISFRMQIINDFFGDGKPGVKLNMFSTGAPISEEDAVSLFQEGYRGRNTEGEYGTGHGLQFIKEVVELHSGVVGYEPAPNGNDFYFVLPA
ncbi:MAG: HAMP domain-containing histidine kinase [Deltaproteobacteria bacterium]|nr:HAMP domain-containing histidine kinase [Deltaproteobacteria bacterium]